MRPHCVNGAAIVPLALMVGLSLACPAPALAAWGSIRGNNREQGFTRGPVHEEHRGEPVGHGPERGFRPGAPEVHERPRFDIADERRHAFFWHDFHPGLFIGALPLGYLSITVGDSRITITRASIINPARPARWSPRLPSVRWFPNYPPGRKRSRRETEFTTTRGELFICRWPVGFRWWRRPWASPSRSYRRAQRRSRSAESPITKPTASSMSRSWRTASPFMKRCRRLHHN